MTPPLFIQQENVVMQSRKSHAFIWAAILVLLVFVPGVQGEQQSPQAVSARFESSVINLGHRPQRNTWEWSMLRDASRVETRDGNGATGELWQRHPQGMFSYHRLFHAEKRSIDYSDGDLRSLHRFPEWEVLSTVVDMKELRKVLKKTGEQEVLGRGASRYQGQVNGVDIEVLWLEQERLPALVRQSYSDRVVTLQLKAVWPATEAPWSPTVLRDYDRMDYADIGDNEADKLVQGILHEGGSHQGHQH
jgi:hypothetical protein